MGKKKKRSKVEREPEIEQDETFYFIAGYTSWGFPYGVTWEQAYEEGLMDEEEKKRWEQAYEEGLMDEEEKKRWEKLHAEIADEDIPF